MINLLAALILMGSMAAAQEPPPVPRPERRDPLQPPPPRPPDGAPRVTPPPGPPPPPGERRPGPAPNANLEEVREWLKTNEPETHRRLMQLQREGHREEVMRILHEAGPRMRELNEMKERDPRGYERLMEMRRIERESLEQAEAARHAGPEQREAAIGRLRETLNRLFDAREEMRARELAELKRRVAALEKAVTERKAAKDRIVEKRRRELMGEKSEDDW